MASLLSRLPRFALALCLPLAGCVAFEHLPTGVTPGCDTGLAGSWRLSNPRASKTGLFTINDDCDFQYSGSTMQDAPLRKRVEGRLETFALGDRQYLVLDPMVAEQLPDISHGKFSGFVSERSHVLVRYALGETGLNVYAPQLIELGAAVGSGQVPGRKNDTSFIEITLPADDVSELLGSNAGYFDGKAIALHRVPDSRPAQ
jgi:hypothetical protein